MTKPVLCSDGGQPPSQLHTAWNREARTGNVSCRAEARVKRNDPMTNVLSGTELARPFVPAADFELSKRFYVKLGFEKVLDGDVAVFRIGSSGFILTRFRPIEDFTMQLIDRKSVV